MKEAAWAGGMVLLMVLLGLARAVPFHVMLHVGQLTMYGGAAIGVPVEIMYFALLGASLRASGRRPVGWYWRPFMHHHLLLPRQRWWVLPFYYVGALSFAIATLGIAIVVIALVMVSVDS